MFPKGKKGSFTTFIIAACILLVIILIERGVFEGITKINFEPVIWPLAILFVTVVIARIAKQVLHEYFTRAGRRMRIFDRTRYALFGKLVSVIIYVIGIGIIVSMIPQLRAASVSLFAGAGVLAIFIGFATQKTFGNLASGVFIATFQPYRIGDRIKLIDEYGTVQDINLRHTVIETWDNRRIIIPNSKMDEEVINNFTIDDPSILGTLDIGISYDSDIDRARKIVIEEAMLHPDFYDNDKQKGMLAREEPVKVRIIEMSDSSVILRLYYWAIDQPTNFRMRCDLLESIKKRFDKEGIEIPFPYRTVVYKKDLDKPKHGMSGIKTPANSKRQTKR
ncbi:mechanosensitive ion channel family protein [Candidatus Woesearchaeota archaeon]|nr:mechanosensitive ion channel family protein [Candidatus Woesearchaeota archaeon]